MPGGRLIWRAHLDALHATDVLSRCKHVNFIANAATYVPGEEEFLLAPFSVFTVRRVVWSTDPVVPHVIEVEAANDNAFHRDDLPTAPWA